MQNLLLRVETCSEIKVEIKNQSAQFINLLVDIFATSLTIIKRGQNIKYFLQANNFKKAQMLLVQTVYF